MYVNCYIMCGSPTLSHLALKQCERIMSHSAMIRILIPVLASFLPLTQGFAANAEEASRMTGERPQEYVVKYRQPVDQIALLAAQKRFGFTVTAYNELTQTYLVRKNPALDRDGIRPENGQEWLNG